MRKVFLMFVLTVLMGNAYTQQNRNFKRGYGFGRHFAEDMRALSVGTTWWYNWWHRPDMGNDILTRYREFGMEFVPQAWNGGFNDEAMRAYFRSAPHARYIMGWNEPNFRHQANMTPAEAARQWYRIEAIAAEFGLKIIGPALNYSPDPPYHDPFEWKDAWLRECELIGGCRWDFVNVHSYMNTVEALEWFMGEWKRYGKPIWLTEFCAWDGIEQTATPAYQMNFMRQALPMLDNNPAIYRYAWFIARSTGIPYNSLLTANPGELTPLGYLYTGQAVPGPPQNVTVTLSVVDRTRGAVTNSVQWPDQSVYTWLGNTTTWASLNNMPAGTVTGNWVGMYNGLVGGSLTKTSEEWIWSFTFTPAFGLTYNWNPGIWVNTARSENSIQQMHLGRNLAFTVDQNGNVSGEVTLIIENATAARVSNQQIILDAGNVLATQQQITISPILQIIW